MFAAPAWSTILTSVTTMVAVSLVIMPLALLNIAMILRQRRSPSNSLVWLMTVLLLPLIGLPLFWLFGSRKITRIAKSKPRVLLTPPTAAAQVSPQGVVPVATAQATAALGDASITGGNAVKCHQNGEEAFADLLTLIDAAQHSIHIETYILKADTTGTAILEHLTARAKAGVQVRLLVDGLGSLSLPRKRLRALRRAGGKFAVFLPIWRLSMLNRSNLRDHRKVAVFDDVRVFAGGRNLADEYLGAKPDAKRWADFSFVMEGPAAAHYAEMFRFDWEFACKEKIAPPPNASTLPRPDGAVIQVVPSGPDVGNDALFSGLLSFIFAAQRRLWIVSPYFLPNESLAQALQIAVQRGVDVRVVVPAKSDQWLVDLARAQFLRDLAEAGGKIMIYPVGLVHAKVMVIDDAAAAVGSANFDSRSLFLNFEVTSIIHSPPDVAVIAAWTDKLLAQCRPFDAKSAARRDTLEGLARLVMPML